MALCFLLVGCKLSSDELEYQQGEKAVLAQKHSEALRHFKKVVDRAGTTPLAMKATREAARISHYELKQIPDAIKYYKHLILYSPDQKDRIEAQKKIAELHFTQTLDYSQAIIEFSRLLDLPHTPQEAQAYRLSIARSYYYQSNFFQAQVEIDQILANNRDKDMHFDALLLKANILLTSKKLDDAVLALRQIIEKYPDRAKAENIGLVLAVTYQEQDNFAKAIETLESIKDTYPRRAFIEGRIKSLKERQTHLPGAKGLRK